MPAQPFVYLAPLVLLVLASLFVALDILRSRRGHGTLSFVLLMLGSGWYAACYALHLASPELATKIFWARLSYVGILTIPAAFLGFVWAYGGRAARDTARIRLLLAVEPTITSILLWTNDWHHWMWVDVWLQPYLGPLNALGIRHGPWFRVHLAYSYLLVGLSFALLGWTLVRSRALRRQTAVLVISAGLPLLGNLMAVTGRNPLAPVDPTPLLGAAGVVFAAWGLRRWRVFDILPVARDTVMDQVDEAVVVANADGVIVDINAAGLRLLHKAREEVIGHAASSLLPFYDGLMQRYGEQPRVREEIEWSADESRLSFELHRSALLDWQGRLSGYLFVLHDISARKLAEEQARQRSQELAMLYDTALEVASQRDLTALLQVITERAIKLLHASTGDLCLYRPETDDLQSAVQCGLPPELRGTVLQRGEGLAGKVLQTGALLAVEDYRTWPGRARAYEGQPFGPMVGAPLKWGERILGTIDVARQSGPPFTAAEANLLALFANQAAVAIENARLYADMQRELGERRVAEGRLEQRTQELSTLYATSLEVVSRLDLAQLLPTIVERAASLLHGRGAGIYLYQPTSDILQYVVAYGQSERSIGRTLQRGEGLSGKVLESGQPMTVDDYQQWPGHSPAFASQEVGALLAVPLRWGERVLGTIDVQREAGHAFTPDEIRIFTLFANQAAIALANAQLYEAARRELAERKSTEARLQQAQRMEAVGVLAGGVAHEFNNLLSIIQGNVELAIADLTPDHPVREALSTVTKTTQRAATLTRQLLAFSRRQVLQPAEVDLNELIAGVSRMLQPLLGSSVQVEFDLASDLKHVLADAGAMEQVLMNLALNARDAMPEGGRLRIETAPATLDEAFCRTRASVKPGEYVRLTVSDTGVGMDEATQRRVFEPFFTTKEVGRGTGLGLSVVYGIVRQHEGLIEVQSEPGHGTRFDVYLPVYNPQ